MGLVGIAISILLLVVACLVTAGLIAATLRTPAEFRGREPHAPEHQPLTPGRKTDILPPSRQRARVRFHDRDDRIRLFSRVLFVRRSFDAITLDCTLLRIDAGLPPDLEPPEGLPFTLRLRCPDTTWFAGRVEELLNEWAAQSRELLFELRQDHGKIRAMIACGESSVQLELAGAAGLDANLKA